MTQKEETFVRLNSKDGTSYAFRKDCYVLLIEAVTNRGRRWIQLYSADGSESPVWFNVGAIEAFWLSSPAERLRWKEWIDDMEGEDDDREPWQR